LTTEKSQTSDLFKRECTIPNYKISIDKEADFLCSFFR